MAFHSSALPWMIGSPLGSRASRGSSTMATRQSTSTSETGATRPVQEALWSMLRLEWNMAWGVTLTTDPFMMISCSARFHCRTQQSKSRWFISLLKTFANWNVVLMAMATFTPLHIQRMNVFGFFVFETLSGQHYARVREFPAIQKSCWSEQVLMQQWRWMRSSGHQWTLNALEPKRKVCQKPCHTTAMLTRCRKYSFVDGCPFCTLDVKALRYSLYRSSSNLKKELY